MTSYSSCLKKLYQRTSQGQDFVLEEVSKVDTALGAPSEGFLSVHIAGSNGKGSVATKIASSLEKGGYRVGLYTSPHLSSYRERTTINGEMIGEEDVIKGIEKIEETSSLLGISLTFFAMTTLLAFSYFKEKKVDIAVIETGIGGRLDATNIITPILSMITSVSLEHTDWLGNTLDEIAKEKGGIIKQGVPVLLGPTADRTPIREKAIKINAPLHLVPLKGVEPPIEGDIERTHCLLAKEALKLLSKPFPLSAKVIEKGIQKVPKNRFEVVTKNTLQEKGFLSKGDVVLDVAHNVASVENLFKRLRLTHPHHQFEVLFGFSKKEEVQKVLALIAKEAKRIHLAKGYHERLLSSHYLADCLEKIDALFSMHTSFLEGFKTCVNKLSSGQILVVCGSFFLFKEIRACLGLDKAYDP